MTANQLKSRIEQSLEGVSVSELFEVLNYINAMKARVAFEKPVDALIGKIIAEDEGLLRKLAE